MKVIDEPNKIIGIGKVPGGEEVALTVGDYDSVVEVWLTRDELKKVCVAIVSEFLNDGSLWA